MENFKRLAQEYFGQLTDKELELIHGYFTIEKLKKNDFFTSENKICDRLSIINKGILRVYTYCENKEITQWISTENSIITEVLGFFFNQANRWNIQACCDTELFTITKTDYQRLCKEFDKWNQIEKNLLVKCFAMMENRIFSHLCLTAQERYQLYFEQNKALFNQVPLQYIASILGMTPETFSRIRKQQSINP
ncbi:Crp/Fnr family transcriptional regulator [Myroides sp. LJL116]